MTNVYSRLGVVDIQTVRLAQAGEYARIIQPGKQPPAKVEYFGRKVKLFSDGTRLKTFYINGTQCSACGLEARFYAVERHVHHTGDSPYHLNLWGIDANGDEVLFTHDHTLARSAGGADHISNTTTMCSPCNFAKSLVEKRGK